MATKFIDKYPGEVVRSLSWKQPYASLMLHGKVETRTWDSKYLGWVLICSSQKPYSSFEIEEISGIEQANRGMIKLGAKPIKTEEGLRYTYLKSMESQLMPLGKAIAVGKLWKSEKMDFFDSDKQLYENVQNACFVKFQYGLWMHSYKDVQPIVPFDWKGTQGWKTLDEETINKIILL